MSIGPQTRILFRDLCKEDDFAFRQGKNARNEGVVKRFYAMSSDPHVDADGQSIESFGMSDNLMMIGALEAGMSRRRLQDCHYLCAKVYLSPGFGRS